MSKQIPDSIKNALERKYGTKKKPVFPEKKPNIFRRLLNKLKGAK